jgi:hypothetical protein
MGVTKVSIEELPAELAERIRELRDPIDVIDRDHTVATIYPVREASEEYMQVADPSLGPIGQYEPTPLSRPLGGSAVDVLLAEREEERSRKK